MLVGGKGGYINSLVAQIVGINGKVVTISANKEILDVCKERVDSSSPFKQTMEWKHIKSVQNTSEIKKEFRKVGIIMVQAEVQFLLHKLIVSNP